MKTVRSWLMLLVATLILTSRSLLAQQGDTAEVKSIQDGVYTEEQARRGEALNERVCANCHMQDFFIGTFLKSWSGATVGALYDLISTSMPEDRPGALKPQQYADVLAYIFELNGVPPGKEILGAKTEILRKIIIERSKK